MLNIHIDSVRPDSTRLSRVERSEQLWSAIKGHSSCLVVHVEYTIIRITLSLNIARMKLQYYENEAVG